MSTKYTLGIESSCDESAASIVGDDRSILSNVVMSQHIHEQYGGVVPEVAARQHLINMEFCINKACSDAGISLKDIDFLSVTTGPGLVGSLIVGVTYANGISSALGKRIMPVNHLEAHMLTPRLENELLEFPYIVLLMSGGHTQICLVQGVNKYMLIGQTLDDAVGECFDKVARMLQLGYPGGPHIERLAANGDCTRYKLPLCMIDGYNFSFSGLKTAVRNMLNDSISCSDLCASFQRTVGEILVRKCIRAINQYNPKAFVICGGVAANQYIRNVLMHNMGNKVKCIFPSRALCTDNAAMVAWAGMEKYLANIEFCATYAKVS